MSNNRYGIDLGKIMMQTSAIKTAKMRRNKLSLDMERDEYEDLAYSDEVAKTNPNAIVAAMDENEDGTIDASEKKRAKRRTGMKYNALSKIDNNKQIKANRGAAQGRARRAEQRTINREAKKDARDKAEYAAKIKLGVRNGLSESDSKLMADAGVAKTKQIVSTVSSMNEQQQYMVLSNINAKGRALNNVMEIGAENPQAAEQEYQSLLKAEQEEINQLFKSGNKEAATKKEEGLKSLKPTLLNQDGSFDMAGSGEMLTDLTGLERDIQEEMEYKQGKKGNSLTPYQEQTKTQSDRTHQQKKENSVIKAVGKSYGEDVGYDNTLLTEMNKAKEKAVEIARKNPSYSIPRVVREAKENISKATSQSGNLKQYKENDKYFKN